MLSFQHTLIIMPVLQTLTTAVLQGEAHLCAHLRLPASLLQAPARRLRWWSAPCSCWRPTITPASCCARPRQGAGLLGPLSPYCAIALGCAPQAGSRSPTPSHRPFRRVSPSFLLSPPLQNYSADLLCSSLAAAGLGPEEVLRLNDPRRPAFTVRVA